MAETILAEVVRQPVKEEKRTFWPVLQEWDSSLEVDLGSVAIPIMVGKIGNRPRGLENPGSEDGLNDQHKELREDSLPLRLLVQASDVLLSPP